MSGRRVVLGGSGLFHCLCRRQRELHARVGVAILQHILVLDQRIVEGRLDEQVGHPAVRSNAIVQSVRDKKLAEEVVTDEPLAESDRRQGSRVISQVRSWLHGRDSDAIHQTGSSLTAGTPSRGSMSAAWSGPPACRHTCEQGCTV